jgi:hypothetical protein
VLGLSCCLRVVKVVFCCVVGWSTLGFGFMLCCVCLQFFLLRLVGSLDVGLYKKGSFDSCCLCFSFFGLWGCEFSFFHNILGCVLGCFLLLVCL